VSEENFAKASSVNYEFDKHAVLCKLEGGGPSSTPGTTKSGGTENRTQKQTKNPKKEKAKENTSMYKLNLVLRCFNEKGLHRCW
jgi:hypothetical protein